MNILILCYPTFGGSGVVASELGIGLAEKGHTVHFISNSQPVRLMRTEMRRIYFHQVSVFHYPLFEFSPYESAMTGKVLEVVKRFSIKIIHVHYAIPYAMVANSVKEIMKDEGKEIKVITTLHGTDITLVGKDKSYSPVVAFSINKSDVVTAVSKWLKEQTYKNFSIEKEIQVIYNFVDCKKGEDCKKQISPDKYKYKKEGEFLISHISNFRKVKRVQDIIRSFHIISNHFPSKLVLAGDGPERCAAQELAETFGIAEKVSFLGNINVVKDVLRESDVYFLVSESESFGLSALEAMACGTPVIASNSGGIVEFVKNGYNGFISKIGDIDSYAKQGIELFLNEKKQKQFRENAIKTATKFSKEKIITEYEQVYQHLLEE